MRNLKENDLVLIQSKAINNDMTEEFWPARVVPCSRSSSRKPTSGICASWKSSPPNMLRATRSTLPSI